MESQASEIRQFSVARIPILLQTANYARAVVTAGRAGTGRYPDPADRVVEMMLQRQRLAEASPPQLWAVMDEAALHRKVGGREIMREQIEHLMELSSQKTTFLQFIPFSGGAYAALDLPFVILGFPDQADADVAAIGYPTGVLWIEEMADVQRYNVLFHHLQAAALSLTDSAALLSSALKDL
jgi:hypothetical protein